MTTNPLLTPSPLPHGLPAFAEIRDEHYLPAFEQAMAEQRREVAAIAADPAEPDFENTFVALERSGRLLRRVAEVFYNKSSADSSDAISAIEEELAPMLAAPGPGQPQVTQVMTTPSGQPMQVAADGQASPLALAAPAGNGELEQKIDIARIEGQVKASSIRRVSEFVENHPEESVSILRSWLHEST